MKFEKDGRNKVSVVMHNLDGERISSNLLVLLLLGTQNNNYESVCETVDPDIFAPVFSDLLLL